MPKALGGISFNMLIPEPKKPNRREIPDEIRTLTLHKQHQETQPHLGGFQIAPLPLWRRLVAAHLEV